MKRENILVWSLVFALLSPVESVAGKYNMAAFPLGIRLSNPGNIKRDNSTHWEGMTRLQDDKKYIRFDNAYSGLRAVAKLIINYKRLYNLDTLTQIINRYAPPSENQTRLYIEDVSIRSGFFPNEPLNLENPNVLVPIMQSIIVHENGIAPIIFPPYWYEDSVYYEAVNSALDED